MVGSNWCRTAAFISSILSHLSSVRPDSPEGKCISGSRKLGTLHGACHFPPSLICAKGVQIHRHTNFRNLKAVSCRETLFQCCKKRESWNSLCQPPYDEKGR